MRVASLEMGGIKVETDLPLGEDGRISGCRDVRVRGGTSPVACCEGTMVGVGSRIICGIIGYLKYDGTTFTPRSTFYQAGSEEIYLLIQSQRQRSCTPIAEGRLSYLWRK